MPATRFQTVVLRPLTGLLDLRSAIDETPPGAFRYKESFAVNPDGKLARALGWTRAFPSVCYGNADFHEQSEIGEREPLTFGFASITNDGVRHLFIGTKSRLLIYDPATGVPGGGTGGYVGIGDGVYGNDGSDSLTQTRFRAAELQNIVLFTNNLDNLKMLPVPVAPAAPGTVADVPSLNTLGSDNATNIGVTTAKAIISFSSMIFIMNTVENGVRYPSRIRWCDLNDPQWWSVNTNPHANPTVASLADYQDLDYGEEILNVISMSGAMYVFTDRSIWRCVPQDGTIPAVPAIAADPGIQGSVGVAAIPAIPKIDLKCSKVYTEPKNRARCLAYPNTLVSVGSSAFYLGSDGVYEFNQYMSEPDRVEWLHRATAIIFKQNVLADSSGTPIDTQIDRAACNSPVAEFVPGPNADASAGDGEIHFSWPVYNPPAEFLPDPNPDCATYLPRDPVVAPGINAHTLVANVKARTCDYRPYGTTMLVNYTPDATQTGGCNRQSLLLAANGTDLALKQMNNSYAREMYDPATHSYSDTGYFSVLRGVFPLERYEQEKIINRFLAEVTAIEPNDPAVIRLRIGTSFQSLDPNFVNGLCGVIWHQMRDRNIGCQTTATPAVYAVRNIRPKSPLQQPEWNFYWRGNFLYYELVLANPNGTAPIGAGCTLSRIEVDARLV